MMLLIVLAISVLLQFSSAFFAFRLVKVTGKTYSWVFISAALFLMGVRRLIPMFHLIFTPEGPPPDQINEIIGLLLSIFMFIGVMMIRPLFDERKQTEELLAQSEHFLNLIIEHTPNPMWISDKDGTVIRMNQALRNMLEVKDGEIIGKYNVQKDIQVEEQGFLPLVQSVFTGGKTAEITIEYNTGKEKQVELQKTTSRVLDIIITPILDEKGRVINAIAQHKDITDRRLAEKALLEHNALFSKIFSQVPGMLYQFARKPDGTYSVPYSNDGVMKIFGCSPDDVRNTFEPIFKAILAEDRDRIMQTIEESAINLSPWMCEYRVQLPDEPVKWIFGNSIPEKTADGTIFWSGYNTDITERKRAEDAMRESERKFHETVVNLDEGFYSVTLDGVLLEHNQSFNRILGFDGSADMRGLRLPDFLQNPEERHEYLQTLTVNGSISNYQINAKTQSGEKITVIASAHFVKDKENRPLRIEGVFLDITGREKAEEALRFLSVRQEAILSAVPDIIMEVNSDKVYTWANQSGIDFFGDDVIGKEARFYFEGEQDTYGIVKPLFDGGEKVLYVESWQRRRDGAKRLLAWWCRVLKDESGNVTGALSSAIDITERKRVEEILVVQKSIADIMLRFHDDNMYHEVLQVVLKIMRSPFGVFGYIDETGALVVPSMNRHICDKCQLDEKNFIFPKDKWGDSSWPRAIREKKTNFSNKISVKTPEGHIAITRHISLPILFQGEVIGLFQVANKETDYTDTDINTFETIAGYVAPVLIARLQRQLREKEILQLNAELEDRIVRRTALLEAANKELEAFSYSVSHDLRAPLRHINGYVDLLTERFRGSLPEKVIHYLDTIADSARQMATLIDNLLQFSRTGRQEMRQAGIDMNIIFMEMLETVKKESPERSIEWVIVTLPYVYGDNELLRLVWFNLLSNAVKFTRRKEKAIIETGFKEDDKEYIFFVRDNGAGFDMQYAHKLFGVFQRLHSSEDFEGTGIGLANVRRIILKHGGRTWAEGELDKGAAFYFTLPKNKENKL